MIIHRGLRAGSISDARMLTIDLLVASVAATPACTAHAGRCSWFCYPGLQLVSSGPAAISGFFPRQLWTCQVRSCKEQKPKLWHDCGAWPRYELSSLATTELGYLAEISQDNLALPDDCLLAPQRYGEHRMKQQCVRLHGVQIPDAVSIPPKKKKEENDVGGCACQTIALPAAHRAGQEHVPAKCRSRH